MDTLVAISHAPIRSRRRSHSVGAAVRLARRADEGQRDHVVTVPFVWGRPASGNTGHGDAEKFAKEEIAVRALAQMIRVVVDGKRAVSP